MTVPSFHNGLAKMPNGVYYMRFKAKRRPGEKTSRTIHESTGCRTRAAAQLALDKRREDDALEAQGITPRSKAPSLASVSAIWERHQLARGKSASQIRNVTKAVVNHFSKVAHWPIPSLTTKVVQDIITEYLEKGNTQGGANHLLRNLNTLVNFARRRKLIHEVPYDVKQERTQELPRVYLPLEKVAAFFEAAREVAPQHAIDMMILMYACGFREDDARHVRVELVDLQMQRITPFDPKKGTKGKEAQPVPIPLVFLPHIARMINGRTEGYLVPGREGLPHKRAYTLPYVKAAAERIGLPNLTPHKLRGTFATLLHAMGAPAKAIQEALRHKDERTTDIYIIPRQEDLVRAMERLSEETGMAGAEMGTLLKRKRHRKPAHVDVAS